ncbi:MAG: helix-turn-helix transcriptional regulator [Bacteroidales bacterium]|nr:helix-turn-helix transcriptional regulator [Bacteroidales bacterium]
MLDEITERVLKVQQEYKLSNAKFADIVGIQRSSVSHLKSGRSRASVSTILGLLKAYTEIRAEWMFRGEGSMLKESKEHLFAEKSDKDEVKDEVKDDSKIEKQNVQETEASSKNNSTEENQLSSSTETTNSQQAFNTMDEIITSQRLQNPTKQVIRVIIFYSDKTFSDFRPE